MSAQGSPRRRTSSGTVEMVSSSGTTDSTSSHDSGVETWPPVRGRANQAPKTVLCGAFWLKSTKTRLPALLLPPVGRDVVGKPALELAGQRQRTGADLHRVPAWLQPEIDVQAVAARGLGVAPETELFEEVTTPQRGGAHLVEADALRRVEVDAQLVGVGGVGGQVRPEVEPEAADVHRPDDVRDVGDDERVGGRAVGRRHDGGLQPVGGTGRDALLVEGLAGARRRGSAATWPAARRRC